MDESLFAPGFRTMANLFSLKNYLPIAFSFTVFLVAVTSDLVAAPFVPARDAQCVAFSSDGKLVATGISGMTNDEFPPQPHPSPRKCGVIQIFDAETGKRLQRMETFGDITNLQFSPDGKRLAYSRLFATAEGVSLNAVVLHDVADGRLVVKYDRCHAFDLSPEGNEIVVLSRTKCQRFNMATGEKIGEVAPLSRSISVGYSPDGKRLAAIVMEEDKCRLAMCDVAEGNLVRQSIEFDEPFYSFSFSHKDPLLASGHAAGTIVLWDVASLKPVASLKTGNPGIARPFFSPDGELLGAGCQDNGDVVFWSVETHQEVRRYTFQQGTFRTFYRRDEQERVRPEMDPARFVFAPDSGSFLAGCYGGMIRLVADGRDIKTFGD
jgi:WD40 repeat protein